ncbi:MAG: DUF5714 domain-containing protein [Candidatus Aquicultor sp.]
MVCGEKLHYGSIPEPRTCNFCNEVKPGSISCVNGHFVCDACHGKDAFHAISDTALNTQLNDPLEIAELMMLHPAVAMIGGEHHAIVAGAVMAALKNSGPVHYNHRQIEINDFLIERTLDRTWTDKLASCMCANYGACGAALAAGAVYSLLTDATCDIPKTRERQASMEITNYAASEIAAYRGSCCKLSTRIAIDGICLALKEHFGIELPLKKIASCQHKNRNPYRCLGALCPYSKSDPGNSQKDV